jgi:hypothetical protein
MSLIKSTHAPPYLPKDQRPPPGGGGRTVSEPLILSEVQVNSTVLVKPEGV